MGMQYMIEIESLGRRGLMVCVYRLVVICKARRVAVTNSQWQPFVTKESCVQRTGVRSLSSSVADVAASIKSSHLLPYMLGSALRALRFSLLILSRSCFALRALCVSEFLRGRELWEMERCMGGSVF